MRLLSTVFLLSAWLATTAWTCHPRGKNPADNHHEGGGPFHETEATETPDDPVPDPPVTCTDPCEGGLTLLGPETFARACGAPADETRLFFVLPAAGPVCVVVTNDGNASARIDVDGAEVIGPSAFNPHVTQVTASLPLEAGEHELAVRVASIPGTSITVELRACEAGPPVPLPCSQVATDLCLAQGWRVGLSLDGGLICTAPGVDIHDNCATCEQYNLYVWSAGVGDPYCPRVYLTEPGDIYGGHEPCACTNDLLECGTWELQGCLAD